MEKSYYVSLVTFFGDVFRQRNKDDINERTS